MKRKMFNGRKVLVASLVSAMSLGLLAGCGSKETTTADGYATELYLYNWSEYMTEEVKDQFEEEYGIEVIETTYESNDELLAKLLAGGNDGSYDIAMPSNYYITALIENDLLATFDATALENFDNLDPAYTSMGYDPDNQYSVPYMGTLGVWIGNTAILDELGVEVNNMEDLLDPALENNIILTDDTQQIIEAGLMGAGLDPSVQNIDELDAAKEYLLSIDDNVKAYSTTLDARTAMANGEAALAYMYSGEALQAMLENPDLEVVMSEELVSLSLDAFVILSGSEHQEEAQLFIDFCLREDIAAQLINEYMFTNFNTEAVENLDEELQSSPLCVMTDEMKDNLFYYNSLSSDFLSAEVDVVTEIKASR